MIWIVASRMAEAGFQTLLLEGGGLSYGVTGGDLDSRRPVRDFFPWTGGFSLVPLANTWSSRGSLVQPSPAWTYPVCTSRFTRTVTASYVELSK